MPNDLGPRYVIQQILMYHFVFTAQGSEILARLRSDLSVVDLATTRPGHRPREQMAASSATYQTLHEMLLSRASWRMDVVLAQELWHLHKGSLTMRAVPGVLIHSSRGRGRWWLALLRLTIFPCTRCGVSPRSS